MKTLITLAFSSFLFFCQAGVDRMMMPDTLDCKKDLTYDKKAKFFYKKGDESRTPVSGNAICYPKKGMVNKGKLVNGKWNGLVTGYKDNRVVGRANYKNGVMDGLMICYADNGRTKDSTIYKDGNMAYSYMAKFDKSGHKTKSTEMNYETDVKVETTYGTVNNMEYVSEINRYKNGKKNYLQEYMKGESEAAGSLYTYTYEEQNYVDGELKTITYYNKGVKYKVNDYADGKLAVQNDIGEDGNVAASYPLKRGKKHGTAIIYSKNSEKPTSAEYSRGKLVTSK